MAKRAATAAGTPGAGTATPRVHPGEEAGAFDRDTAVRRLASEDRGDGRPGGASFAAEIAPEWCINGRPHGGYLAAIIVRALLETVADPLRAPRSLTIHFLRPPRPGAVRIEAATERAGGSLSTLSGRVEQDEEPIALALAAFSLPRASIEVAELPMPAVAAQDPSRQTADFLRERIDRGLAPSFLRKLVLQPRDGATPFSGSEAPMEASAWLGLAEASRPLDAVALALFSDAHFPTPFVRLSAPAGAPTIDLTVHFRAGLSDRADADSGDLCLARFRSRVVHEGFFEEDGVIWAADGTVLAQSRQLALLTALARG
ncbi:MAG TPA: thioesterase family protein [Solirubrobacteraceae bacterium]|nr:thioesterase family protein [Solirubrobacteraceae bacterium]